MKRFQSVSNVQLNTIGRAALLELRFTDGSSDAVEIECDRVGGLISALLKTCAMLGHRKAPPGRLEKRRPRTRSRSQPSKWRFGATETAERGYWSGLGLTTSVCCFRSGRVGGY